MREEAAENLLEHSFVVARFGSGRGPDYRRSGAESDRSTQARAE